MLGEFERGEFSGDQGKKKKKKNPGIGEEDEGA